MELRSGYTQTEVGVIPRDWIVKRVSEFADIKTGPFGTLLKAAEYSGNDGVPLISVGEIRSGFLKITDHTPRVPESVVRRLPQYVLRTGDIVFGRKGSVERSALIHAEQDGWFLGSDGISIRPSKQNYPPYLALQFQSSRVQGWLIQNAIGTTMASLNQGILRKAVIALPPTKAEQEAIAEALSDADALLESLEQLIAKKRHLKQGAMQELLTGKKRLPGFSQEGQAYRQSNFGMMPFDWETMPLERVAAFITKGSTPTTYGFEWRNEGVLFLRSECVSERGLELSQSMFIAPEAHLILKRSEVRAGDILMTITGNVGRVVRLSEDFGEANINQHIARIRIVDKRVTAPFVYHFLSQPIVRKYYNLITTGQAYPQISLSQVRATEIPMPTLAEQTAIATVLSDMDAEIVALEAKLTKTRQLKQGMMQNLLIGKIRLV